MPDGTAPDPATAAISVRIWLGPRRKASWSVRVDSTATDAAIQEAIDRAIRAHEQLAEKLA